MEEKEKSENLFKESAKRFTRVRNQKPSSKEVKKIFEVDITGEKKERSQKQRIARQKDMEI